MEKDRKPPENNPPSKKGVEVMEQLVKERKGEKQKNKVSIVNNWVDTYDDDVPPKQIQISDYYYALNIRNISSESNTEGVVENIKGNKIVSYEFPNLVGKCTPQRTVLFMPSNNYISNYSNWPEAYDYVIQQNPSSYFNGQLIDNPIGIYNEDTQLGYYAANFNICLTSSLANVNSSSQDVTIDIEIVKSGGSTTPHLLNDVTVPAGTTLVWETKVVLTTGDKIQGLCSAASSIDFTINYLKQT